MGWSILEMQGQKKLRWWIRWRKVGRIDKFHCSAFLSVQIYFEKVYKVQLWLMEITFRPVQCLNLALLQSHKYDQNFEMRKFQSKCSKTETIGFWWFCCMWYIQLWLTTHFDVIVVSCSPLEWNGFVFFLLAFNSMMFVGSFMVVRIISRWTE